MTILSEDIAPFQGFAEIHPVSQGRWPGLNDCGPLGLSGWVIWTVWHAVHGDGVDCFSAEIVGNMRTWKHSGFSVDNSVRINAGNYAGMQCFDPLDFLAEVTQHIPNKGEHHQKLNNK